MAPHPAPVEGEGAALLIECRGESEEALHAAIGDVCSALGGTGIPFTSAAGFTPEAFRHDPKDSGVFWDARKVRAHSSHVCEPRVSLE